MSETTSAATGRCFGIQRVCQVWERSRSALYARRARAHHRVGAPRAELDGSHQYSLESGFPFCLPLMAPFYTRGPPSERNVGCRTIVQLPKTVTSARADVRPTGAPAFWHS